MTMTTIRRRLEQLEAAAPQAPRQVRRFMIQGPQGMPCGDAVAFLRACGHEIRDQDLNIIRCVIGAEDGRPVDLPLEDLTAHQSC